METTGQVSHTGTSDYPHYRGHSQGNGHELAPKSWTGLILGGEGLKGLIPIVHRGQALESLLDAFGVVPLDVVFDGLVKVLDGVEDFCVVHLGFQVAKEVLHYCVVVAVGFSRH